jgi:hypothetical protein
MKKPLSGVEPLLFLSLRAIGNPRVGDGRQASAARAYFPHLQLFDNSARTGGIKLGYPGHKNNGFPHASQGALHSRAAHDVKKIVAGALCTLKSRP